MVLSERMKINISKNNSEILFIVEYVILPINDQNLLCKSNYKVCKVAYLKTSVNEKSHTPNCQKKNWKTFVEYFIFSKERRGAN